MTIGLLLNHIGIIVKPKKKFKLGVISFVWKWVAVALLRAPVDDENFFFNSL